MVLAVFLLAGLFTILQGTRHTSTEQTQLAQLQDNERLAMMIITEAIQGAGYYPTPATNSLTSALPVDGAQFPTAGQAFYGALNGTQGETLYVRFATNPNDGILNCIGNSNTGGSAVIWTQIFQVNASGQFTCQANFGTPNAGGTVTPLVSGMVSVTFQYGVNTIATTAGTSNANCPADTYLTTTNMAANNLYWTNVCSVLVTLIFNNPLYQPAGQPTPTQGQPQTVTFQRVIDIMSKVGVDVVNDT
jgi:type IV pilus assembly protein PilW